MAPTSKLEADRDKIHRALEVMFDPGQVIELRVPNAGRSGTIAGYFDDHEKLIQAACRLNRQWTVYTTLNRVNPALLARGANRMIGHAKHTTSDADILERRWLPIDLDPVRPAGVSSTDEEHEIALARAREIADWVTHELGWPSPILADSGNGGHVLWRVALPNDAAGSELVGGVLEHV